jgi:hypothetical protein
MQWKIDQLKPTAVGVSASRRTEIPGLFARWFERRLEEGWAEYVPAGPPRRVRRSIAPPDVTHFTFWSRWPRPFFRTLECVLRIGYPVLWNVTITGLGRTAVEPYAPTTEKAVAALLDLSRIVPPAAIQWRYDPVFLSQRFGAEHHVRTFSLLAEALRGRVDRVTTSAVQLYGRRVEPDLREYERESGDRLETSQQAVVDLLYRLREIATAAGIPFTLCGVPELRAAVGCDAAGCNAWAWATRVYPVLQRHRTLPTRPSRPDCACSEEFDIGVYDTCVFGCRYSYGSCNLRRARANFAKHDPDAACIVP